MYSEALGWRFAILKYAPLRFAGLELYDPEAPGSCDLFVPLVGSTLWVHGAVNT